MPKFDPNKPPMSLRESEKLLKESNAWEESKLGWSSAFGEILTVGAVLGTFGLIALALWLLSLVIGPTPAGIIGLIAVMIWLGRKE